MKELGVLLRTTTGLSMTFLSSPSNFPSAFCALQAGAGRLQWQDSQKSCPLHSDPQILSQKGPSMPFRSIKHHENPSELPFSPGLLGPSPKRLAAFPGLRKNKKQLKAKTLVYLLVGRLKTRTIVSGRVTACFPKS